MDPVLNFAVLKRYLIISASYFFILLMTDFFSLINATFFFVLKKPT